METETMRALLLGAGNMGRAIGAALTARGDTVTATLGRDVARTDAVALRPVDVAFEFSHADAVAGNARVAAAAGARVLVVGTSGWAGDAAVRDDLAAVAVAGDMRLVAGATFSVATVLFTGLAVEAARRFGRFADFDPYVFEHHRRTKPDRPSGTALAIAQEMLPHLRSKRRARLPDGQGAPDPETLEVVALRAGASPGMHVVGFDAPGESIELRVTARDRSAYVAGALLAADTALADPDLPPGLITFAELLERATTTDPQRPGDDR
jgi:4-hydroxy-tetrahydrodipicolinate reductase